MAAIAATNWIHARGIPLEAPCCSSFSGTRRVWRSSEEDSTDRRRASFKWESKFRSSMQKSLASLPPSFFTNSVCIFVGSVKVVNVVLHELWLSVPKPMNFRGPITCIKRVVLVWHKFRTDLNELKHKGSAHRPHSFLPHSLNLKWACSSVCSL